MTAAELSDLLLEAALVVYAGAVLAFVAEILLAGRPGRAARSTDELQLASAVAPSAATPSAAAGGDQAAATVDARRESGATSTSSERWTDRGERAANLGVTLMTLAAAFHLGAVVSRGIAAGRAPWGNMFEFATTGSLVVALVFLGLLRSYQVRFLGVWVGTFVLIILGLSVTVLYVEAAPLLPALRSTWLVIHVFAAIVSTGLFTVGAILSLLYLLSGRLDGRTGRTGSYLDRLPDRPTLDRLAFRVHAVAFPIYTFAVLIAGPIWAQYAWGRYWGWDPKEVWAFITWVVYAAYLHARVTAGWKGRQAAVVAMVGYGSLLFNFIGVNILFSGFHSYAGM